MYFITCNRSQNIPYLVNIGRVKSLLLQPRRTLSRGCPYVSYSISSPVSSAKHYRLGYPCTANAERPRMRQLHLTFTYIGHPKSFHALNEVKRPGPNVRELNI